MRCETNIQSQKGKRKMKYRNKIKEIQCGIIAPSQISNLKSQI